MGLPVSYLENDVLHIDLLSPVTRDNSTGPDYGRPPSRQTQGRRSQTPGNSTRVNVSRRTRGNTPLSPWLPFADTTHSISGQKGFRKMKRQL